MWLALTGCPSFLASSFMSSYPCLGCSRRSRIASLLFGLSELKLVHFQIPSYVWLPQWIQKRGDYLKVFVLGLLLGNAGIGCPNPITYVVLTFAATTGDWLRGAVLMGMNGVGRVVPLLLLTVLMPHLWQLAAK